ncbi:MAG: UpxY family transcription antiterminator [Terracidiphilus sp.]
MMLTAQSTQTHDLDASGPGWWAVYTRHQHERVVADTLAAKGFEVFLPLFETLHHWKDRDRKLLVPLFPCYLFVRERAGGRLQIVTTPGAHMILSRGEALAVIPADEMHGIWQATRDPARVEPHPFLKCGEHVRVVRGPLEGVEGILIRKKNQCRLILSVEMLAQSAAVEVDANYVVPASQPVSPRFGVSGVAAGRQLPFAHNGTSET